MQIPGLNDEPFTPKVVEYLEPTYAPRERVYLLRVPTMTSEPDDFDFNVFLPKRSNPDLLDHTAPNEVPSGSKLPIEEKDWLRKIDPFNLFLCGMIAGFIATVIGAFIAYFFLQLRYGA